MYPTTLDMDPVTFFPMSASFGLWTGQIPRQKLEGAYRDKIRKWEPEYRKELLQKKRVKEIYAMLKREAMEPAPFYIPEDPEYFSCSCWLGSLQFTDFKGWKRSTWPSMSRLQSSISTQLSRNHSRMLGIFTHVPTVFVHSLVKVWRFQDPRARARGIGPGRNHAGRRRRRRLKSSSQRRCHMAGFHPYWHKQHLFILCNHNGNNLGHQRLQGLRLALNCSEESAYMSVV